MAKKKQGKPAAPRDRLSRALQQARTFLQFGQPEEALDELDSFPERYPDSAPLFELLGDVLAELGRDQQAMLCYERAVDLCPGDTEALSQLLDLYERLNLAVHLGRGVRLWLQYHPGDEQGLAARAQAEEQVRALAEQYGVDVQTAEEAAYAMENGRTALEGQYLEVAVQANRRALALIPRWPIPRNNLSVALFQLGSLDEAIAEVRTVLDSNPESVFALGHLIRMLVLLGRVREATSYWERLRQLPLPEEASNRQKMVQAAALLQEDRVIYDWLRPRVPENLAKWQPSPAEGRDLVFLATAAANLGYAEEARRYWNKVRKSTPFVAWAEQNLASLRKKLPGLGWADRYPYFMIAELISLGTAQKIVEIVEASPDDAALFYQQFDQTSGLWPQIILAVEQLLWAEQDPAAALPLLESMRTPPAQRVMRRFATSQAGDDSARLDALAALIDQGAVQPGETVRVWLLGEWRDIAILAPVGLERANWAYAPELYDLMAEALSVDLQTELGKAEQLYRRLLDREPRLKEAWNNLSKVYVAKQDMPAAWDALLHAIDIDPDFAMARLNMAVNRLLQNDAPGAWEWLSSFESTEGLNAEERSMYHFLRARLFQTEGRTEEAKKDLAASLVAMPDFEPALNLLEEIEKGPSPFWGFPDMFGLDFYDEEEDREEWEKMRRRQRRQISRTDAGLAEILASHPADVLRSIARTLSQYSGWSALKKAELVDRVTSLLLDRDNLTRVVNKLRDQDRAALGALLQSGGAMLRQEFEERFPGEGTEEEEEEEEEDLDWSWGLDLPPWTPFEKLRSYGLLAEGLVDGQEIMIVPVELRGLLPEVMGKKGSVA